MQQLEVEVNEALAIMERDFPVDIQVYQTHRYCIHNIAFCFVQVIIMHLIRHIVDGMQQFGPVYATWMYGYERFNSWLHRRVTNRRYPEATLMETQSKLFIQHTCMIEPNPFNYSISGYIIMYI